MLDLLFWILSLTFHVQHFEDGSAIISLPAVTITVPAFDSAGDQVRIVVTD